jgi:DNA-binding transcriptional LysR family regulator
MMKIEGIAAFAAVADAGSITAAASRLALSKSVVSERLADLEREVGARLIQRSTRKLALTDAGHAFLARADRIRKEVHGSLDEAAERQGQLTGPLRLSGPVSFGSLHLGPALYSFLDRYPGVSLTLDLDDRFVDIAADGYDAVVRHGPVRDGHLVARRLAPSRRMLVASPGYLAKHGRPRSIDHLRAHRAILFSHRENDWRFMTGRRSTIVRPKAAMHVNNGLVLRDAAVAGLGIALVATFLVYRQLGAGALEVVDVGTEPEGADLVIAYPKERTASAKVQALTKHLRRTFGDPPYWDAPAGPDRGGSGKPG